MLAQTARTGSAVAFVETASPAMILVACPVVDASAIWRRRVLGSGDYSVTQTSAP